MRKIAIATVFVIIFISLVGIYFVATFHSGEKLFSSDDIIKSQSVASHDGSSLAFATGQKINILNVKNKSSKLLSINPEETTNGTLEWASNDKQLVYASSRLSSDGTIDYYFKAIDVTNNKQMQITKSFKKMLFSPLYLENNDIFFLQSEKIEKFKDTKLIYAILWHYNKTGDKYTKITEGILSPHILYHNQNVYYLTGVINNDIISWDIHEVNIVTGQKKSIVKDAFDFQINGDLLYYFKLMGNYVTIHTLSLKDYSENRICDLENIVSPTVSPDGRKIVYIKKKQIWEIDLPSMRETKLTSGFGTKRFPLWYDNGKHIIYSTLNDIIMIKQ